MEVSGLGLAVWARRCLGKHWSGRITIKAEHELIRGGPYRWVRHPIYSALLAMYFGVAVVSGEWHALLGFVLVAAAYVRKIRIEEANLMQAFGDEYQEYRSATSALIPGVY